MAAEHLLDVHPAVGILLGPEPKPQAQIAQGAFGLFGRRADHGGDVWFLPENRVVFGVLTLLGSCMILLLPLQGAIRKIPPAAGMAASAVLFVLTRDVNRGFLGFEGWNPVALPDGWYRNLFTAWLGFPEPGFFSTDYFSLFPWIFLFLAASFSASGCRKRGCRAAFPT